MRAVTRYAIVVAAVALAYGLTVSVPILRDRFTFFLFWPLIFVAAWFGGTGAAALATALALLAVLSLLPIGDPVMFAAPVVFGVSGVVAALLARWRDQVAAALAESGERFRTLADTAPCLIWMAGPDQQLSYVNRAWLELTGRRSADELGQGWRSVVELDDAPQRLAEYTRAVRARQPFVSQFRLRRHDGVYRTMLNHAVPRLDATGRFLGYIGACVDITEQREAIERAEQARAAAEASNRAKDVFLATVSHELRTPLSPILAWVRMLRDDALDAAQRARALVVIERNARLQAQLIEDLLDVSRIVSGKMRLQVRPVILSEVIENAVETIRPAAEARAIRLHTVLDSTVPPIAGDAERLQQAVWNLLANAVKFTAKGGRVGLVLERVNSHLEIAVSDTGEGFAPAALANLFERFWQADSTPTRAHGGLGLGLAIVRHIMELHGGSVHAESAGPGQGSTFTLRLPLIAATRSAGERVRRHPTLGDTASAPVADLSGVRVLLVDDEPDANEAIRLLLAGRGAEVRVAASAPQALEILGRWTPDVVLSDIGMPGTDGYGFIAQVRALRTPVRQVPVVAMTAFAAADDRARMLAAGFELHLTKPADPAELTAAIAAVAARGPGRE